jgi:hypothetical protein
MTGKVECDTAETLVTEVFSEVFIPTPGTVPGIVDKDDGTFMGGGRFAYEHRRGMIMA